MKSNTTAKLILTISLIAFLIVAAAVTWSLAQPSEPAPSATPPVPSPSQPSPNPDAPRIPTTRIAIEPLAESPVVKEPVVAPPSEKGGTVAPPAVATEPFAAPVPSPEPTTPAEVDRTPKVQHVHPELYRPGCDGAFRYSQETSAGGTVVVGSVTLLYSVSTYPTETGFGARIYACADQEE